MKLKLKKQNGITLVALVITIIVLLILAMVSIKIATGDGLIKRANDATSQHTIGAEKEAIQLGYAAYQVDLASKGTAELKVKDATATPKGEDWNVTFAKTNNEYQLLKDGTVTLTKQGNKTESNVSNTWWKLTDEEKESLNKQELTTDYKDVQTIATSSDGKWISYMNTSSSSRKSADGEFFMIMPDPYKAYIFPISANSKIADEEVEQYTWYYTEDSSGFTNAKKYTGQAPISKNDFTMIIDKMTDLVDRMIKSF